MNDTVKTVSTIGAGAAGVGALGYFAAAVARNYVNTSYVKVIHDHYDFLTGQISYDKYSDTFDRYQGSLSRKIEIFFKKYILNIHSVRKMNSKIGSISEDALLKGFGYTDKQIMNINPNLKTSFSQSIGRNLIHKIRTLAYLKIGTLLAIASGITYWLGHRDGK